MIEKKYRLKRTKVVATIGPTSLSKKKIRKMILAGLNVCRINFSHSNHENALKIISLVNELNTELNSHVAILGDLQGPKLRIGVVDEQTNLITGNSISLQSGNKKSNIKELFINYDTIHQDVKIGEKILLDDGKIILRVLSINNALINCKIIQGGSLKSNKGVNLPNTKITLPAITNKDYHDLLFCIKNNIEWVALSFVRSSRDILDLKNIINSQNGNCKIIAKIEKPDAIKNLKSIISHSDALMVARGDLGVEVPTQKVPVLQKKIVRESRRRAKPVIIATQVMESMITNLAPTRAETNDAANAVFDGTSAVMLSGETAIGEFPVESVQTMSRIAQRADEAFDYERWAERVAQLRQIPEDEPSSAGSEGITDAMTLATWRAANELDLAALLCISGSGFTVRSMARFRPNVPILGMTMDERTAQQLTLSWGVTPYTITGELGYETRIENAINVAIAEGHVKVNDLIGVLAGITGDSPATDVLRIMRVP